MKAKLADIVFGAIAGLGLGVSALLLYEYSSTAAVCGPGGGCAAIRASSYASIAGIPTPLFGVVFFAVAAALRLADGPLGQRLLPPWLAAGALAGAALIGVQAFVLETFCTLCLVVDISSLALLATWALGLRQTEDPPTRSMPIAVLVAALAPLIIGIALASEPEAAPSSGDLPAPIAAEQRPGAVTVVEFIDFQCPHCRMLHRELEEAKEAFAGEVRVVRKHVPLPSHEHARGAAIAAVCAEAQGRGDPLADAMLRAEDLTPGNRELLADQVGLDMEVWRDCLDSDFARETVERHVREAEAIGVRGLPTYYIGDQRLTGARKAEALVEALEASR